METTAIFTLDLLLCLRTTKIKPSKIFAEIQATPPKREIVLHVFESTPRIIQSLSNGIEEEGSTG